jgi:hypothetical protein
MGQKGYRVYQWQAFPAYYYVTLQLIEPIHRLRRKWCDVNTAPGTVFTTLFSYVPYEWAKKARVFIPGNHLQPNITH